MRAIKKINDDILKLIKQKSENDNDRDITGLDPIDTDFFEYDVRDPFAKDRGRIVFTRAFRRLEHKAQVYPPDKGDHYRTRLTHTMEVVQISRSISRNLCLNENLAESIAFGHDVGHTPFGHQGERILDEIMGGEIDIGGKLKYKLNFGGFKHNYNSVKVLDEIEIKYPYPVKGLNLTWQVKDGILKHTKIVRHKKKSECDLLHERKMCSRSRETCFDITRFMQRPELFKECLKYENPCTLEGQVVAIADEIAQRQHDLDDGLRDKLLELNVDTISDKLIEDITKITQGKDEVLDEIKLLNNLRKKINNKKKKTSERLYRQNSLVRDVINYFILDVTIHSIENINNKGEASIKKVGDRAYITDELISFSDTGKAFNKELEIFITNKIINSETVNKFDGKSLYIVRQLYKAYYTNPRQMPKYVLDRLLASLADNSKSIYPIQFKDEDKPYDYSKKFENGTRDDVSRLISLLKLELDVNKLICPIESEFLRLYCDMENGEYSFKVSELVAVNKTTVNVIKEIRPESEKMHKLFIKCLLENHYVYMATICDFISGMTDNYAIDQYESLYLV